MSSTAPGAMDEGAATRRQTHGSPVSIIPRRLRRVSVSNSWSGGDGELDEVPAVGDPAHMVQIGRDHRVSTGEGQRRVALQ